MTRSRLVTLLTNAVAQATNQTWPEDRHIFAAIRKAIDRQLPKGTIVVGFTKAEKTAAEMALGYVLEFAGSGDFTHIHGRVATTHQNAHRKILNHDGVDQ